MTPSAERRRQLVDLIEAGKDQLAELRAALPAHSARPHQIIEVEELEEQIELMQNELRDLEAQTEG